MNGSTERMGRRRVQTEYELINRTDLKKRRVQIDQQKGSKTTCKEAAAAAAQAAAAAAEELKRI